MNFLAHAYLSSGSDEILIGNLLTDLMSWKEQKELPLELQKGRILHLFIDQYADSHPCNKKAKSILRAVHGKYAPITLDVFQDYLLYKNWNALSDIAWEKWTEAIYRKILEYNHSDLVALQRLKKMAQGRFFESYSSLEGLEAVFYRIGQRSPSFLAYKDAALQLEQKEEELEGLFMDFIPDIREACARHLGLK